MKPLAGGPVRSGLFDLPFQAYILYIDQISAK
jgi:hypothetical protein